ncbi:MAG TPA: hypothetical protein VJR23_16075 [Candidatus Acidoferrales bacterium]|nr:hypothetical protein [Candidatus Acidoferrales bacterium]
MKRTIRGLEHEIPWPRRIVTIAEAAKYIRTVGFCMLFTVESVPLPSLYYHVTKRNRLQVHVWDKYSEMVWRWKDDLPRRSLAFYGKYFRGRGTFISLEQLPNFLALENAVIGPGDRDRFYAEGRIREDARTIWEALEKFGALATLELRNACKMDTKAGNVRFKRAIVELQQSLVAMHSGTEQETGAWASGRYDLICRAFPKAISAARQITPEEARAKLASKFFEVQRDAAPSDLMRLFGWSKDEAAAANHLTRSQA